MSNEDKYSSVCRLRLKYLHSFRSILLTFCSGLFRAMIWPFFSQAWKPIGAQCSVWTIRNMLLFAWYKFSLSQCLTRYKCLYFIFTYRSQSVGILSFLIIYPLHVSGRPPRYKHYVHLHQRHIYTEIMGGKCRLCDPLFGQWITVLCCCLGLCDGEHRRFYITCKVLPRRAKNTMSCWIIQHNAPNLKIFWWIGSLFLIENTMHWLLNWSQ